MSKYLLLLGPMLSLVEDGTLIPTYIHRHWVLLLCSYISMFLFIFMHSREINFKSVASFYTCDLMVMVHTFKVLFYLQIYTSA